MGVPERDETELRNDAGFRDFGLENVDSKYVGYPLAFWHGDMM